MNPVKIRLLFIVLLFISINLSAQQKIEWSADITLQEPDFKAPLPNLAEDNLQQFYLFSSWEFAYQMSNLQFMMTKNFNPYVSAFYIPSKSWLEDGAFTSDLLALANVEFDMAELFARRFRKKLYEMKKMGSNANFYQFAYEEVHSEFVNMTAELNSHIQSGKNIQKVAAHYSELINEEIVTLSDFCKDCKVSKRKKKNKE